MGVSATAAFVLACVLVRCAPGLGLTVDPLEAEPVDSEEKTRVDELSTAEPIDYGGNTEDTGPQTFGPPVKDEDYGDDDTGNGFETDDGNLFETGNGNEFETGNDNVDAFEPGNGNENDFEAGNEDGNSFDAANENGNEFETGEGSRNGEEPGAGSEYGPETDNGGDDAAFEESHDLKKASSVEINAHPVNRTGSGQSNDVSGKRHGVEGRTVNKNENVGENGNKTTNPNRNKIKSSGGNRSRNDVNEKRVRPDMNKMKTNNLAGNGSSSAIVNGKYGTNENKNRTSVIRSKRRNGSGTHEGSSNINKTAGGMSVNGDRSNTTATGSIPKNAYRTYENVNENSSSLNREANILSKNETGDIHTDHTKLAKTGSESKVNGNEYWNGFKHYVTVNRTKSNVVANETENENENGTKLSVTGDEIRNTNGNENTGHASENSEVKAIVVEVPPNATTRSTETIMNNQKECEMSTSDACAETTGKPKLESSGKPAELEVNKTRAARRRLFMKTTRNNRDETEMDVQKGESSKRSYNYDETQVPPPGSEIITYDYGEIKEIIIPENPPPAPIHSPDSQRYGRQPDANSNPNPSHYGYHQKPYFYDIPKNVPDLKYTPQTSAPQDPTPGYYYNPSEMNSSPYPTQSPFKNHAPNQNWDPSFEGYTRNPGQNSPQDYGTYSSTPHPSQNFDNQDKPGDHSEFKNHDSSSHFSKEDDNYASHPYDNPNSYISHSGPETRTGLPRNPSSFGSSGPDATMGPSRSPSDFASSGPDVRNPSSNLGPSGYDNHQKPGPVYEFYGTPKSKTWVSYESIPIKNPSTDSGPPIVEIIYHRENGVVYEDDILDDFTTSSPVSSTSGDFTPTGDFPASDFHSSPERPSGQFSPSGDFPTSGFPSGHERPKKPRPSSVYPNSGNFPSSDNDRFKSDDGRSDKRKGEMKNTRRPSKNRGFVEKTTSGPPRKRPGSSSRPKTKVTNSGYSTRKPEQNHFPHADVDFDDEDFSDSDFPERPKPKNVQEKSKVKNSNSHQKHRNNKDSRKKEKIPKTDEHEQSVDDDFSNINDFGENDDRFPKRPEIPDFDAGKVNFPKNPKDTHFEEDEFNKKPKNTNTGTEDDDFSDKVKNTEFETGDDGFPKTSKTPDFDTDDTDFPKELDDTDFRDLKDQTDFGTPGKGQINDFPHERQKTKTTNSATKKQKTEKPTHEKHKSEKGEKLDAAHKTSEGKKGEKGSKTQKEYSEGEKGHAEEGKESGGSAKKGGKKKAEEDEGGYYAEKHKGEDGEKKGDFHDAEKHHKGHSTKGKHEIHKKDEFSRKHSFYDEHHEGGKHEKHGGYEKKEKIEKGEESHKGGSGEGYQEEHDGKKGIFKKGKRYKGDKGGEDAEGKEVKFSHEEEYGKKGGEEKKEEKEFEL